MTIVGMNVDHSFLRRGLEQRRFLTHLNSLGLQTSLRALGVPRAPEASPWGEECPWGVCGWRAEIVLPAFRPALLFSFIDLPSIQK